MEAAVHLSWIFIVAFVANLALAQVDPGFYLFVVGGEDDGRNRTELVTIEEAHPVPQCLKSLQDHPKTLSFAAGGALSDRDYYPHTCGSGRYPSDECWRYIPSNDSWLMTAKMSRDSDNAARAHHEEWGIIMSGGFSGMDTDFTVTRNAEEFEDLALVPDGEYNYCVAGIDADRVFVTGIGDDNDESYMYIRQTNEWQQLPSMPTGRHQTGCGVVRSGGETYVVVVGGCCTVGSERRVEIYDVQEQIWIRGNPFPHRIRWPAVAQFRNTFLIVGGYEDGTDGDLILDSVYEYDPLGDSWTPSPEKMTYARYGATAITVPTTAFPDCQ